MEIRQLPTESKVTSRNIKLLLMMQKYDEINIAIDGYDKLAGKPHK